MSTLIFSWRGAGRESPSAALRAAQGAYLASVRGEIGLAAACGARDCPAGGEAPAAQGDLMIVDGDVTWAEAAARQAPYFAAGVWEQTDIYECAPAFGFWTADFATQIQQVVAASAEALQPPEPSGALFVTLLRFDESRRDESLRPAHVQHVMPYFNQLAAAGGVDFARRLGGQRHAPWSSYYFYQAPNRDEADRRVRDDPMRAAGFFAEIESFALCPDPSLPFRQPSPLLPGAGSDAA